MENNIEQINETANIRKLATVATVLEVLPIDEADNIECIRIRGWKIVVKKNEYHVGDKTIYVEIDALMPDGLSEELQLEYKALNKKLSKANTVEEKEAIKAEMTAVTAQNTRPEFEFLRQVKFRIKTRKILGSISQGICFPLSILENTLEKTSSENFDIYEYAESLNDIYSSLKEDDDLTEALGITQYEAPEPGANLGGDAKGQLGSLGILVSDEARVENLSMKYERMREFKYVVTEKLEGCLDQETTLETEDGIKTIKNICDSNYSGKVKSFDIEQDKIVFSKITGKSIKENISNKKWFEIETEDGQKLILTENHQVWLPNLNCWRRADDLVEGLELLVDEK